MGKIFFTLLFSLGKDFMQSVSPYLYKLDEEFLNHGAEDEMVLYGCMLKQYRLHCSWTLHISCEHLYNSVCQFAFIPLERCKSEVYLQMQILPCLNSDHALRIQNTFCFEVSFSLSNSKRISFKYLWIGLILNFF